jgi:predicted ABC-type ATPase
MKKSLKFFTYFLMSSLIAQSVSHATDNLLKEDMDMPYDVCNLDLIYNNDYTYSLPRKDLASYLSGKAFGRPEDYSELENANLCDDIHKIFQDILSKSPSKEKVAIMTAGAPGSGKTIKMRQDIQEQEAAGKNFAYICPDDICLQNMEKTYKPEVDNSDGSQKARLAAYNKWRPGSNAATHLILGNLIRENYGFYFGTTSTGPFTWKFLDFLKKQGYQIRLIYVSAPDDIRWKSLEERDKTFIQTTRADIIEKGEFLPQRINDTFLKYADQIDFCFRDEVQQDAKLVAKWVRNEDTSEKLGTLEIIDQTGYDQIKTIHNTAADALKRPDLNWETSLEMTSKITQR